jgi:mono/diheme cytochrome c family protein/uncharacterized membrane protein
MCHTSVSAHADASKFFQQHCAKCHGTDGTGGPARDRQIEIPNFTSTSWHQRRSDAQLQASILEGKGKEMPPWRGKLREEQVHELVAFVRAFAPAKETPKNSLLKNAPSGSFDKHYRNLEKQLQKLQKQFHETAKDSSPAPPAKPPQPSPRAVSSPQVPKTQKDLAIREVFQQQCAKCHGRDGSGGPAPPERLKTPDFTNVSWQLQRTDAQLRASILDGKGKGMPPWRGTISEEAARGLVAHIRALVPRQPEPDPGEPDSPDLTEAEPSNGFGQQLTCWLGKFHPSMVNFPIALLTAAAVAELLRLATGQPAYHSVCRFCIWFGALTAVVAGVLGWCRADFSLTDVSWVMTTHRWLGTTTATAAVLVLVLSEVTRRPGHNGLRPAFVITLFVVAGLVLATGFFGGALVFGLDHYRWPQ